MLHVWGHTRTSREKPHPEQSLVSIKENSVGVLLIKVTSGDRPPTEYKVQGRHISAYNLIVEVVYATTEGRGIMEGIRVLSNMLASYISTEEVLEKHQQKIQEAINKAQPYLFESKQRKDIERAISSSLRFFKNDATKRAIEHLDRSDPANRQAQDCYRQDSEGVMAIKDIDPALIRDKLKSSDLLGPLSGVVSLAIRSTLKIMNKMKCVTFIERATRDPGKDEAAAVHYLRSVPSLEDGEEYEAGTYEDIGQSICDLFDYPVREFIRNTATLSQKNKDAASICRKVMRKHIKLIHDAFPKLRPALQNPVERKKILMPFIKYVRGDLGWGNVNEESGSFVGDVTLYETIDKYITFSHGACQLDKSRKFQCNNPPNYRNQQRFAQGRKAEARKALTRYEEIAAGGGGGGAGKPTAAEILQRRPR
jgi:hypothetical protein